MSTEHSNASSQVSRLIPAKREQLYLAFVKPRALEQWLAPAGMTAKVHEFDGRVDGGYEMSLYYGEEAGPEAGKSAPGEDRYRARYVELTPPARVVLAVTFDTDDPAFAGEMTLTATLTRRVGGTEVTLTFTGIPPGIDPQANAAGTQQALEQLEGYVAQACTPRPSDAQQGQGQV